MVVIPAGTVQFSRAPEEEKVARQYWPPEIEQSVETALATGAEICIR
jgi:hypothetical protein